MGLLIFAYNYLIQPVSTPSKSGQSHGTAHFLISKRSSPIGLLIFHIKKEQSHGTAHFSYKKGAVPWDCSFFPITTQFSRCRHPLKMGSPMGLPIFYIKKEQSHGTAHFFISKRSSPMGLPIFLNQK